MIIAIASGKGGTGKTTIATNLAYTLSQSRKIALADLDVEEPNSALFLDVTFEKKEKITTFVPKMNDNCVYCGRCSDVCEFNAIITLKEAENILVFNELCHSCYACQIACPHDAIEEGEKNLGTIEFGKSGKIEIWQGDLRVGEAMAVPLIKEVQDRINPENYNVAIYDSPPGTSCPVIEATKDADFVVLVTEPTPFGLHDLKLAVDVMKKLGKNFGVVVNKANLGDRKVYDYCEEENISILMELPQDEKIAKAYAKGELPAKIIPEIQPLFTKLFEEIQGRIQ